MSVEIRPGEWLIMGGYDGSWTLQDTQLLKDGIFTHWPKLPEPIVAGSAAMLNKTHALVAASWDSFDESANNYLLDINSQEWTQISARNLPASDQHSSGSFYNSTAGESQVANIGEEGIKVYSSSNDSWH